MSKRVESHLAEGAVGFAWASFNHGVAFWENPSREHLPPPDEADQIAWLEGFLQAHADHPDDPCEWINPTIDQGARAVLRRILPGPCDVDALLALLERMQVQWREAGEFRRMRL